MEYTVSDRLKFLFSVRSFYSAELLTRFTSCQPHGNVVRDSNLLIDKASSVISKFKLVKI